MIKFHSEPWLNVCEWRMISVLITRVLWALRAGLMCMHVTHLREPSFHMPARRRYSWRSFGIDTPRFPCLGRRKVLFVCLQPLPSNHIITALKADIWQKPRKWARWRRSSFCCSYYLITLFSCEMLGVCLCKAIIYLASVCHHNYPPEIHKWSGCCRNRGHSNGGKQSSSN